jgi:MFS family permease
MGMTTKKNYNAFIIHALFLALTTNFIDTNTVVPNMLTSVGGTAFHMGVLSAILIGGTKVMQLLLASLIINQKKKKPALLIGINIRVLSLLFLAFLIANLKQKSNFSVWLVIFVMTLFSFSGSYANIAYTDVMGKVIESDARKKLLINKQLIASFGTIVSSFVVKFILSKLSYPQNYQLLFFLAGILLLLGSSGFYLLEEGERKVVEKVSFRSQIKNFGTVLKRDKNFRRYLHLVNTSGVIISTLPFLLLFGKSHFEIDSSLTGTFLLLQMGGSLITTTVLTLFSRNQKYRFLIYLFIGISFSIPILAFTFVSVPFLYALVFLLGGVSFALSQIIFTGILLEITDDDNRALYTGLSGFGSLMQVVYPLVFGSLVGLLGYKVIFILTSLYILLGLPAAQKIKCNRLDVTYL